MSWFCAGCFGWWRSVRRCPIQEVAILLSVEHSLMYPTFVIRLRVSVRQTFLTYDAMCLSVKFDRSVTVCMCPSVRRSSVLGTTTTYLGVQYNTIPYNIYEYSFAADRSDRTPSQINHKHKPQAVNPIITNFTIALGNEQRIDR